MTPSADELLLRIAFGEPVEAGEARRCLGLSERDTNARTLRRARARKVRDAALQEAARALSPDSPSPWILAQRLAKAVERFEARKWPRIREGLTNDDMNPHEQALCRAFLVTGGGVPRTSRSLYELLKK